PFTTQVSPLEGGPPVPFTQHIQQPKVNTLLDVDQTLHIPDGGTVLLGGCKVVRKKPCEFGPPVLSKIPYISRLFKNVGIESETEQVLLMVTARILASEEETEPSCPYLKQKATKASPDAVAAPPTTVLDNLARLAEGRKKLHQAEQYRKKGEIELARCTYEEIRQ